MPPPPIPITLQFATINPCIILIILFLLFLPFLLLLVYDVLLSLLLSNGLSDFGNEEKEKTTKRVCAQAHPQTRDTVTGPGMRVNVSDLIPPWCCCSHFIKQGIDCGEIQMVLTIAPAKGQVDSRMMR